MMYYEWIMLLEKPENEEAVREIMEDASMVTDLVDNYVKQERKRLAAEIRTMGEVKLYKELKSRYNIKF